MFYPPIDASLPFCFNALINTTPPNGIVKKLIYSATYISLILAINALFAYSPNFFIFHHAVNIAELVGGMIYIFRDLAQQEIQHYIIALMLIGVGITYIVVDPQIAKASIAAFIIGESIDWVLYTWSKQSMAKRLLISSLTSAPVDSFIFLLMIQQMNTASLLLMIIGKWLGVFIIFWSWSKRNLPSSMAIATYQ